MNASKAVKFKKRTKKTRLTKRTIEALPLPGADADGKPGRAYTYDAETPRLAVCSFSTGARTWYWIGRVHGRVVRHKLGEFPEVTPENAKKLAAQFSNRVACGEDPRVEKRRKEDEPTLGEAFAKYLEQHAKLRKRTWRDDDSQFKRYFGPIKARKLSSFAPGDVSAWHSRLGKDHGPYAANRALSLLSAIFTHARANRHDVPNPCRGVRKFPEQQRKRRLSADEVKRFFEALEQESELMRDYFKVAIFTGARRSNLQSMRWDELHLDSGTWVIPGEKFKNGVPQSVYLPPDAVAILRRRQETVRGAYVFPGRGNDHIAFIYKAWGRICENAKLQGVRPHDLRRTLGSWQADTGASTIIIGASLGHLDERTTRIYTRVGNDPVRAAVDTAIAAMTAETKGGEQ